MATEKTPTLYLSKATFENDSSSKEKLCSRSIISWIVAALLISLFVVLTIQFLYAPYEQKIRIFEEQPIEVRVIPPTDEDSEEKQPGKKPSNPWDFDFLMDPADLCTTRNPPNSPEYEMNPEVKFLMLVPSAVDHFEQRQAIRNTWGSVAKNQYSPMRLGFVVGTTSNKTVGDRLQQESLRSQDIIQGDFEDGYYRSTVKSVLMLKWVAKRCPHAQFFLKAEDDTFVNVGTIANILNTEPYISQDKFIGGYVKNEALPLKSPDTFQEIYISIDEYPLTDCPPYASGSYMMTIPTAIDLFDAVHEVQPILPQEDAFLTGLCAQHIDVPLIHEPTFVIEDLPSPPSWSAYSSLSTAHGVKPNILEQVWEEMNQAIANSNFFLESAINSTVEMRKKKNL